MLQIVYISTARQPHSQAELETILAQSRRNNSAAGVSGLLVAGGRRFLQALEGPEAEVLAAYARIQADPRHHALVLLSCRTVEERAFGDWAMAFEEGGSGKGGDLPEAVAYLAAPLLDKNLKAQFLGFAEVHARAAA